MSFKNGMLAFLHYSSFLPPATIKERLHGKKHMLWPVLPQGGLPYYLILDHSHDITLPSESCGFKYLRLFRSSPLAFIPPK